MSRILERNLTAEECGKIRALREVKGIGLTEFAKKIKISPTYLSRIEMAERCSPSYKILKSIALGLGVEVKDICSENNEMQDESLSFDAVFLSNKIEVEGVELSDCKKIEVYKILKVMLDPKLTNAKKLELIIPYIYTQLVPVR